VSRVQFCKKSERSRATQVISCIQVMTGQRWSVSLARADWIQPRELSWDLQLSVKVFESCQAFPLPPNTERRSVFPPSPPPQPFPKAGSRPSVSTPLPNARRRRFAQRSPPPPLYPFPKHLAPPSIYPPPPLHLPHPLPHASAPQHHTVFWSLTSLTSQGLSLATIGKRQDLTRVPRLGTAVS
jgi:hypothetical protein